MMRGNFQETVVKNPLLPHGASSKKKPFGWGAIVAFSRKQYRVLSVKVVWCSVG
jgi:hypothetical protein